MKSSKFDIFKLEFTPRIPEIERGLRDYFLKMHRIRKIKPESIVLYRKIRDSTVVKRVLVLK
jgi:hypothetical protein